MSEARLQARPRLARWVAVGLAIALVVFFTVNALLLPGLTAGLALHRSDQVAVGLVGLVLAGVALLFARPRLRADEHGVQVRNVLTTRWLVWEQVVAVSFPEGAPWARLELADDEFLPIVAIQAVDRARAVHAIRELRSLYGAYASAQREQSR